MTVMVELYGGAVDGLQVSVNTTPDGKFRQQIGINYLGEVLIYQLRDFGQLNLSNCVIYDQMRHVE